MNRPVLFTQRVARIYRNRRGCRWQAVNLATCRRVVGRERSVDANIRFVNFHRKVDS